ncbi:MAG TPA: patatin-like phospholipase family protein [Gammaproteobacteria bacterium]
MAPKSQKPLYVLALDGGGAKGFYTLGVLRHVEAMIGMPIHQKFGLMYGTSTGSIITSLLALGYSVDEVHTLYKDNVPKVMRRWTRRGRSKAVRKLAVKLFEDKKFDAFKTDVGIVATKWDLSLPMIFKTNINQAFGRRETFKPGFDCTIADAVQASCAAYPYFNRHTVKLHDGTSIELGDGGFCANNPALYAIGDATVAMGIDHQDVRLLSIGVGIYPMPPMGILKRAYYDFKYTQALIKFMEGNTNSMEHLRGLLFRGLQAIRIDDTFSHPELAMDFMEGDVKKLAKIFQRGGDSYAKVEQNLRSLLK